MNDAKPKKLMTRRRWLGLTLAGGAAIAVLPPLAQDRPSQIIRSILTEKLKPADIPPETYQAFLDMYIEEGHYDGMVKAHKLFSTMAWLYPTGIIHRMPALGPKIKHMEELVITHFTLSTNFFHDEKIRLGEKPVLWISYWRKRACNNPFAQFETV